MIDYRKIISNREVRLKLINCLRFIPSEPYLKLVFWIKTGKRLNLKNPKTFCDKLNWLKLHDIHPEYTQLADKIAVRDHIKQVLGKDICIPLLGAWEHYDDIDFDSLPEKFVLKCNHDSGSVKIIQDKSEIDHTELKKFFEGRLNINAYVLGREYPYKDIKPMICAEKYMVPDDKTDINDYKFLCFNGKPEMMYIISGRSTDCRLDYFDMDFNRYYISSVFPASDGEIEKPPLFEEMKSLVSKLCPKVPFIRVDLFEISGKLYFAEFTFYDDGGFWPKSPIEWEYKFGDMIPINT